MTSETLDDHRAFTIAQSRTVALRDVQRMSKHLRDALQGARYYGPMAVAGGYVRDMALGKPPKDLDVFLDAGYIRDLGVSVRTLAEALAALIPGAYVHRVIPCYGSWASDIDMVVQVKLEGPEGQANGWLEGCPMPASIDIVVLRRAALVSAGYDPTVPSGAWLDEMFLKAVIKRVDLRMNAIGVTPEVEAHSPQWDYDALACRLTVQYERRHDDMNRIEKRLERLTGQGGKFRGWQVLYEGPSGELSTVDYSQVPLKDEPVE